MKFFLFLILFSSFSYSNEFQIINSKNIETLVNELKDAHKLLPTKDTFMKQSEYEALLKKLTKEIPDKVETYAVNIEFSVPCEEYSRFCYETERENFVINNKKIYKEDYIQSFNKKSETSEYDGQTILQKNIDKKTNVLEINSYEERLIIRDVDKNLYQIYQDLNLVKEKFDSFNLYLVFDVNKFDESHETSYKRYSRSPPTIDNPVDNISYSKNIFGDFKYFSIFYGDKEIFRTTGTNIPIFIPTIKNHPKKAIKDDIHGYVEVEFLIEKNGNTKKHQVIDSKCAKANIEMLQTLADIGLNTKLRKNDFNDVQYCEIFNKSALKSAKSLKYKSKDEETQGSYTFFYVTISSDSYQKIDWTKYMQLIDSNE